ncbi:MAG: chemotaxis protein CheX [Planctomycetes bacterium]|nr:chemotaxis protein CheX [Planctomycetota bacterium]
MRLRNLRHFVRSAQETFATQLRTPVIRSRARRRQGPLPAADFTALVELQGAGTAFLALSFTSAQAGALASRLLQGAAPELTTSLLSDCVCEIANMVAGLAVAHINRADPAVVFRFPRILAGAGLRVVAPGNRVQFEQPFEGELGPFSLFLSLGAEVPAHV